MVAAHVLGCTRFSKEGVKGSAQKLQQELVAMFFPKPRKWGLLACDPKSFPLEGMAVQGRDGNPQRAPLVFTCYF